ncbi:MAG TPA: molybdopterin oxidoreductase family protein [Hyphomicrobiaceae bacterium]|nr:molybdopterin oxidoreductase family protein [Hyphomicrobiaceae bacterium]
MRAASEPDIALSVSPADEIKTTTCYMCACRCGIRVFLKDGKVRYIEGNRDHPVNRGVLCGKGSAGIMQHYSPARLTTPLLRVGPRGAGDFKAISWDEALALASQWLGDVRRSDPRKLAFFTGRDQSQALTSWWAMQFGTPNFAAHGGFCSVNMAAAGLYTFGGSFWEFGETDWPHTRYFMLWGVAEDHASNPLKIELGKLKQRGVKVVSVNPVRTGYSAIADEWIGIKPGTDGLFAGALVHELLRTHQVDVDYLRRYSNAGWLVIRDPGAADDGLFARDASGKPLAYDTRAGALRSALDPELAPAFSGSFELADRRQAVPVFQLLAERFLAPTYAPERVAAETGVPASSIRRIAAELASAAFAEPVVLDVPWTDWAGRRHDKMLGRPVGMHAMRGISAHANGFHTCRILHVLQILLGSIDCPGGFRYKTPYPKQTPPTLKPRGKPGEVKPMQALMGPHLGFPTGPEDLLVDAAGKPQRIDKAYSWEAPFAAHGLMHTVIANAALGDPYPIDVLFLYMANIGWNSAMNLPATLAHLSAKDAAGDYKIPKIIYSDAYFSETVAYADLILPDTTYLERWDCISLLDRPISEPDAPADAIRQPVVAPDRDVRPFQSVLIDLGARLRLPGFANDDGSPKYPGGYADYIVNHQRRPGIGPLAGHRGNGGGDWGRGEPNPRQLEQYIADGCVHVHRLPDALKYFKHANREFIDWAVDMGFRITPTPVIFQLYSEPMQKMRLAARGHGSVLPPQAQRQRIDTYFDPLPFWYPPFENAAAERDFPLHAITQRPMAMYHSWGSQNAWLRQIHAANRLYLNAARAAELGLNDDDWVAISSRTGSIKAQVKLMQGVNADTVWTWNAIGKRAGAWSLDARAPEATRGFLLNHLIADLEPERPDGYRYSNSDPVTGQAAWYDLRVRVEKIGADAVKETSPQFAPLPMPPSAGTPGADR